MVSASACGFYNGCYDRPPWTIRGLRAALAAGFLSPSELAESALARSNGNASHNTYLWQDAAWTRAEAARAEAMPPFKRRPVRRRPARALGPAHLGERLLRPRRLAHHVRRAFLSRSATARPRATPGWWNNCAPPEPSSSAKPTSIRWPTESPARIPSLATACSLATPARSPAALQAALRPACRRARPWPPSARTPAAPCARPPRSAGWPDIAPRSAAAIGAAARIWRNPSTPWAGSFAIFEDAPFLAAPFALAQNAPAVNSPASLIVADSFLHDCEPRGGRELPRRHSDSSSSRNWRVEPSSRIGGRMPSRSSRPSRPPRRRACTPGTSITSSRPFATGSSGAPA